MNADASFNTDESCRRLAWLDRFRDVVILSSSGGGRSYGFIRIHLRSSFTIRVFLTFPRDLARLLAPSEPVAGFSDADADDTAASRWIPELCERSCSIVIRPSAPYPRRPTPRSGNFRRLRSCPRGVRVSPR